MKGTIVIIKKTVISILAISMIFLCLVMGFSFVRLNEAKAEIATSKTMTFTLYRYGSSTIQHTFSITVSVSKSKYSTDEVLPISITTSGTGTGNVSSQGAYVWGFETISVSFNGQTFTREGTYNVSLIDSELGNRTISISVKARDGYTATSGTHYNYESRSASFEVNVIAAYRNVTFNLNGGTKESGELWQSIRYGYTATLPVATRYGYTFFGWYEDEDFTIPFTGETLIKEDKNVYAKWVANTYEIEFNPNGGTGTMSNLPMTFDTSKKLPANEFTKTGYHFIGWAQTSKGEVIYIDKQEVTNLVPNGVTTLYAVWEINIYTVTFDISGGTRTGGGELIQNIEHGGFAVAPTVSYEGCEFIKWDKTFINITDNINITANWLDVTNPTINSIGLNSGYGKTATIEFYDVGKGIKSASYAVNTTAFTDTADTEFSSGKTFVQDGYYTIIVEDMDGNISTLKFKLYKRSVFDNENSIFEQYYVPTWYNVSLPAGYANAGTTYSFASYEDALVFAMNEERSEKVTELPEGGWSYLSEDNSKMYIRYTNETLLERAIKYYSEPYISDRKIFTAKPTVLTTFDGYNVLDDFMIEIGEFGRVAIVPSSFQLAKPGQGISGNESSATIKYIHNGLTAVSDQAMKMLPYNRPIVEIYGEMMQGVYEITQTDLCGNVSTIYVYIDSDAPTLFAHADNVNTEINKTWLKTHESLMQYTTLSFDGFGDYDTAVAIKFTGKNLDGNTYLFGTDKLPVLNYINGYSGQYEITVYDRSGNILLFRVTIAGEPASVTTSSTSALATKCTITINRGDSQNVITNIRIYKKFSTGAIFEYTEDDEGTEITVRTLSYVLYNGGQYFVEVTDVYGRTTVKEFFYKKGLPDGILKGVTENGITNKDVSLSYETVYGLICYEIQSDGTMKDVNAELTYITKGDMTTATLSAYDGRYANYRFHLYNTADDNLHVDYIFSVKCVTPQLFVYGESGTPILLNDCTKEKFYAIWEQEDLTVTVTRKATTERYQAGVILNLAGTYTFEVKDSIKNTLTFTITLDNKLDYSLDGNYRTVNGKIVSKTWLRLIFNEDVTENSITNSIGDNFAENTKLEEEGVYTVYAKDVAGNELMLVLEIDKTPPSYKVLDKDGQELTGVATNKAFYVVAGESSVAMTVSERGVTSEYFGTLINGDGKYIFTLTDYIGNEQTVQVVLRSKIEMEITGKYLIKDGIYYSATGIAIQNNTTYITASVLSLQGKTYVLGRTITDEGTYNVHIEDNAGNVAEFQFVIDKTPPKYTLSDENGNKLEVTTGATNKPFRIETNGTTEIKLTINGSTSDYNGDIVEQDGKYVFTLTNDIGNVQTLTLTLRRNIELNISGKYIVENEVYYSASGIIIADSLTYIVALIKSNTGNNYPIGRKVADEGTYNVHIEDNAGNIAEFRFVIDKTPPQFTAKDVAGNVIEKSFVNYEFYIEVERGATATYSINDEEYRPYFGEILKIEGKYTFEFSDHVGNKTTYVITFSTSLYFDIIGSYIIIDGIYYSNDYICVVSADNLVEATAKSLAGNKSYSIGTRVANEGIYSVEIKDVAGNSATITFIIDKTAPIVTLDGVTEKSTTGTDVRVEVDDECKEFWLTDKDGTKKADIISGQVFTDEGTYYLMAEDFLGNKATITFSIDKSVDVSGIEMDGQIFADTVKIVFNETLKTVEAKKDGAEWNYKGGKIEETGSYELVLTDMYGNVCQYKFVLTNGHRKTYNLPINEELDITIYLDEKMITPNIQDGHIILSESGNYLLCGSKDGKEFEVKLVCHNSVPDVEIVWDKNCPTPTSKSGTRYYCTLTKDGQEVEYRFGQQIKNNGSYVLHVWDDYGNDADYEFVVDYVNGAGIAVIVAGCVFVVIMFLVICFSKRSKVR